MKLIFQISHYKVLSNYVSFGIVAVAAIFLNIFILKFYNLDVLGKFNFFYAFMIIFSQFCVGGIQFSVLRHSSLYAGDLKKISKIVISAFFLLIIYFTIIIFLYFIFEDLILNLFKIFEEALSIKIIIFSSLIFALNKIFFMCINGLNLIYYLSFISTLRYLALLFSVIIFFFLKIDDSIIVVCFLVSEFVTFLFLFFWFFFKVGLSKFTNFWIKKHFKFGLQAMFGGALMEINAKIDILIIGTILGYNSVGIYSFASMIAEGYSQLYSVLKTNIDAIFGRNANIKNNLLIHKSINLIRRIYIPLIISVGLLIIILYKPLFLNFLDLNKDFVNKSWIVLIILIISMTLVSFLRPFIGLLISLNKPFYFSIIIFGSVLINLILNLVLIPKIGINGAAFATGLAFIFETVLLFYIGKKFIKYKLKSFRDV
jgi:O-antigen/teichoic acid export membrane protein